MAWSWWLLWQKIKVRDVPVSPAPMILGISAATIPAGMVIFSEGPGHKDAAADTDCSEHLASLKAHLHLSPLLPIADDALKAEGV